MNARPTEQCASLYLQLRQARRVIGQLFALLLTLGLVLGFVLAVAVASLMVNGRHPHPNPAAAAFGLETDR